MVDTTINRSESKFDAFGPPVSAQSVLFDSTWTSTVFQRPVSIELRILSTEDATSLDFYVTATILGRASTVRFPVESNIERRFEIPYGLLGDLKVTDWTSGGRQVRFELLIDVDATFGLDATRIVSEPVTLTLPIGNLPVPQSLADLNALFQLAAGPSTSSTANGLTTTTTQGTQRAAIISRGRSASGSSPLVQYFNWYIKTGDDDRREDSTVTAVTVMKAGSGVANVYSVLSGAPGGWPNRSDFSLSVQIPDVSIAAIDHLELQFQSHASGLESTDNWDISHINVGIYYYNGRYGGLIYNNDWGYPGLRLKGHGTVVIPFNVQG